MNHLAIRKERSQNLKRMRLESGLSQLKLSKLSTVQQWTISKIESGKHSWNVDSEILLIDAIFRYSQQKGDLT